MSLGNVCTARRLPDGGSAYCANEGGDCGSSLMYGSGDCAMRLGVLLLLTLLALFFFQSRLRLRPFWIGGTGPVGL